MQTFPEYLQLFQDLCLLGTLLYFLLHSYSEEFAWSGLATALSPIRNFPGSTSMLRLHNVEIFRRWS